MRITLFIVLWASLLLSLPQDPEKPAYFSTGNETNVTGTISIKGTPPKMRLIDMSADSSCEKLSRKPISDWVITTQDRLANGFVYVKGEKPNAYRFEVPDSDVILNQRACYFEPHVFGLQVGQTLRIINGDPTVHNVHPTPKLNQEWT